MELTGRVRAVWEIAERGYSENSVRQIGKAAWHVSLNLHVEETFRGEHIKMRPIQYSLRVVEYGVDWEMNPFGLAIDCFTDVPREISSMEVEALGNL